MANANPIYRDFETKINEFIIQHTIELKQLKTLGLLYFISLDDFFKLFYLPILSHHQKTQYGEVNTPLSLSNELTSYILESIDVIRLLNYDTAFSFLDMGAGLGYLSASLIKRLWNTFDERKRTHKLWKNLVSRFTMVEINPENCRLLRLFFGENCAIHEGDFLQWYPRLKNNYGDYDVVYGNPPFNTNGLIKVPTNTLQDKKHDGKAIWRDFVFHAIHHTLKPGGLLCLFIPSLWMKGDEQSGLYNVLLRENKLLKMKCYNNTQTNHLFHKHAQTHCGTFLFQVGGEKRNDTFLHWSWFKNSYVETELSELDEPIPVLDNVIERKIKKKLNDVFDAYGLEKRRINVIKTSTPPKKRAVSDVRGDRICVHPCIISCVFNRTTKMPELVFEYSNKAGAYSGQAKLILAHGMYGIPYIDREGAYGISRRDKYVILDTDVHDMEVLAWFLSTPVALFMFENYKYRMRYLEKAGFHWLYDVSLLTLTDKDAFPNNTYALYDWFDFSEDEIEYVKQFERRHFYYGK